MKRQAYTMIAVLILFGCLAVSAKAQCGSMQSIANIPFQFSAGQTMLPAGQYSITCSNSGQPLVLIRSTTDGNDAAMMLMITVSGKAQDRGKLVFRRYGNRYFLAQVWTVGTGRGLELPKSRVERLAEREPAGIKPKSEAIALTKRH